MRLTKPTVLHECDQCGILVESPDSDERPCPDCEGTLILLTGISATEARAILATQHLEASPKPSYGPHKASERYLDAEDEDALNECLAELGVLGFIVSEDPPISAVLEALGNLCTHLRRKYYGG